MNIQQYDDLNLFLRDFLAKELPTLADNWWYKLVLPNLSEYSHSKFQKTGPGAFDFLDLAQYLRLLDRNWYLFEEKYFWSTSVRQLVKALQQGRNDYAHRLAISPNSKQWARYYQNIIELLMSSLVERKACRLVS